MLGTGYFDKKKFSITSASIPMEVRRQSFLLDRFGKTRESHRNRSRMKSLASSWRPPGLVVRLGFHCNQQTCASGSRWQSPSLAPDGWSV